MDDNSSSSVRRVVNSYGPQTSQAHCDDVRTDVKPTLKSEDQLVPTVTSGGADVEERITNMEEHLQIKKEPGSKLDLFGRIKQLEERLLTLEGMSPEYHSLITSQPKRARKVGRDQPSSSGANLEELSLDQINDRIAALRETLRKKASAT